jgi:hypothetical protein
MAYENTGLLYAVLGLDDMGLHHIKALEHGLHAI